jgi:hypothetical protein
MILIFYHRRPLYCLIYRDFFTGSAEKNLITTPGSERALTSLAVDEPLEYVKLYLDGNLQMWVDAEDSRC